MKVKVKELNENWKVIWFCDRAIMKCDLKYMSKEQIERLNNVYVKSDIAKGHYRAVN